MIQKAIAFTLAAILLAMPQSAPGLAGDVNYIELLTQGTMVAVLAAIWYKTFRQNNKEQEQMRQTIGDAFKATREMARENREMMVGVIKDMHSTQRELVGALNRLEAQLDNLED
jgi:membrane protein implicated in regulation of membrane protease activity